MAEIEKFQEILLNLESKEHGEMTTTYKSGSPEAQNALEKLEKFLKS